MVLENSTLQESLREIAETDEFINRVIEIGKEKGFDFDAAEIKNAMQASRRALFERHL